MEKQIESLQSTISAMEEDEATHKDRIAELENDLEAANQYLKTLLGDLQDLVKTYS